MMIVKQHKQWKDGRQKDIYFQGRNERKYWRKKSKPNYWTTLEDKPPDISHKKL